MEKQTEQPPPIKPAGQAQDPTLYRLLTEFLPNGAVFLFDQDLRYIIAQGKDIKAVGLTSQGIEGKTLWEVWPAETAQLIAPLYQAAAAGIEQNGEVPYQGRIFQLYALPLKNEQGEILAGMVMTQDISHRKQMEQQITASEAMFHAISETVMAAIFICQGTKYRYVNPAFGVLTGYSEEESLAMDFWDLAEPEFQDLVRERGLARQQGEDVPEQYEYRIIKKSGEARWVSANITAIQYQGALASIGNFVDVTDRKRVEQELVSERLRLKAILHTLEEGVLICDATGKLVLISPIVEQLTGWSQTEAIGKPLTEVLQLEDEQIGEIKDNPVQKVLKKGFRLSSQPENGVLIARDSTRYPITCYAAPFYNAADGKVQGAVLVINDIIKLQKLEQAEEKARRMEGMELLASGIAHDFNNLLTAMLGNISLAKMDIDETQQPDLHQLLTDAEKATSRARGLTQQLFTLSQGISTVKHQVELGPLLTDWVRFALRGSHTKYQFKISPDLWPVEIDEGQISQVVHNLIVNAEQAMPSGGTITVEATNIPAQNLNQDLLLAAKDKDYVCVSVQDEGVGIPEKILPRIFVPYFTTKSKGNGLGLATSYSIISRHGGTITVSSQVNEGSTFKLFLLAPSQVAIPATQ